MAGSLPEAAGHLLLLLTMCTTIGISDWLYDWR
jgi:hypothetical protein